MTDKRNCAFNQCIQPQVCATSSTCIWNAGDVRMIDGKITGNLTPSVPTITGNVFNATVNKLNPFDEFPKTAPTRVAYIVWNATRTEGYITFDKQVAYEARKGAESNCFDEDGTQMKLAQAFCNIYSGSEDAKQQIVVIGEPPAYPGE